MLCLFFQDEIFRNDSVNWLAFKIVLAGLGFTAASALLARAAGWKDGVVRELLKDTGIALVTAAVVTVLFDRAMEIRKVSDMFALVFGKDVGESVVTAARSAVFKRPYIRENADYIFTVRRDAGLPPDQALITLRVSYYVYALPDGNRNFQFEQELENYHIRGRDALGGDLPRFDFVSIDGETVEGDELRRLSVAGKFTAAKAVTLNPWPTSESATTPRELQGKRITAQRTEIVDIPGSYSLVLSELTKGIRVHIVDQPEGVEVTMKDWFTARGLKFEQEGKKEQYHAGVLLPGQGIHLRLSLKEGASRQPQPEPQATPARPAGAAGGGTGRTPGRNRTRRGGQPRARTR